MHYYYGHVINEESEAQRGQVIGQGHTGDKWPKCHIM